MKFVGEKEEHMIIQILSRITLSLLLMSSSIVIFTYYLPTNAYSQIQPSYVIKSSTQGHW